MKKSKKRPKKKLSLLAMGFKKKPVVVRKGYVNSDTIKSWRKQILALLSENETTPDL